MPIASSNLDDGSYDADEGAYNMHAPVVSPSPRKCNKLALVKTPKAGSSTLGSTLWRYAVKHGLRLYPGAVVQWDDPQSLGPRGSYDFVLGHHAPGCLPAGNFSALLSAYEHLLGTPDYMLVYAIREPMARWLSSFFFFESGRRRPDGRMPQVPNYLRAKWALNGLTCILGEYTPEGVEAFVRSELFKRIRFVPVEYFDEGLALLALECGWDIRELAYMKTNENKGGVRPEKPKSVAYYMMRDPYVYNLLVNGSARDTPFYNAVIASVMRDAAARVAEVAPRVRFLRAARDEMSRACAQGRLPVTACVWYSCSYCHMIDYATGLMDAPRKDVFAPGCAANDTWLVEVNARPIGAVVAEANEAIDRLMESVTYPK